MTTRLPKISIQGWTTDGPAYTVHRTLAGWRNRRARREQGANANELVGPHDLLGTESELPADQGHAALLFPLGELEAWGFRAPHVYEVEVLIDGDAQIILVDASDGDRIETYGGGIELLEWGVHYGNGEVEQPSNISDGAESQEPKADALKVGGMTTADLAYTEGESTREQAHTLTGAQIEQHAEEVAADAAALEAALTPGTPEHDQVVEAAGEEPTAEQVSEAVADVVAPEPESTPAEEPAPDVIDELEAAQAAADAAAEESEPTGSEDGRWEELEAKFAADQITDEELDELQSIQDAARAAAEDSSGDDADAVGGADDPAPVETE